jgi:hypothetical protein
MAFDANGLRLHTGDGSVGASAGLDKIYREATYVTPDAPAVVEAANYFNAAADRLLKHTVIKAVMTHGGATPIFKIYIVTANTGTAVTIAVQTVAAG